ncbi:MAG: YabP/YqfC family sporulation protein [Clostridiales bacterium]|jgi:sporulation protein YqfC|nr:YabP/YqfC family sporulation protein [Clostridiales bacterium]
MRDAFLSEIAKLTEMPFDTVFAGFRYVNFGGRSLYVQGHKGVVSFGTEKIILRVGKRRLEIVGEGLCVQRLSQNDIVVNGKIVSVTET